MNSDKTKLISQHVAELREICTNDEYSKKLGVIEYLRELKIGSWVTTPENSNPALVVSVSKCDGLIHPTVETYRGECWSAADVEVVG